MLKNWYLWLVVALFLAINFHLAWMSWEDIRSTIGWVKAIPQKTDFKLRHFVQFSPQAFFISYAFYKSFSMSFKKAALGAVILVTFSGVISEIVQIYRPTRIPAFMDVFWNFSAALVGGAAFVLYGRLKRKFCEQTI